MSRGPGDKFTGGSSKQHLLFTIILWSNTNKQKENMHTQIRLNSWIQNALLAKELILNFKVNTRNYVTLAEMMLLKCIFGSRSLLNIIFNFTTVFVLSLLVLWKFSIK